MSYSCIYIGWADITEQLESPQDSLFLCKLGEVPNVEVILSLRVHHNLAWELMYRHRRVDPSASSFLKDVPPVLKSPSAVISLLQSLNSSQACVGNPDLPISRDVFTDAAGTLMFVLTL